MPGRLFLPVVNVGAPASAYSVTGTFNDRLPDGSPRRSTVIRVLDAAAVDGRGSAQAVSSARLRFRPLAPPAPGGDPLAPGASVAGDLVLRALVPDYFGLAKSLPSAAPAFIVYRNLQLQADYLRGVLGPWLNRALAVFNQQGQAITTTDDGLRGFARGEIAITLVVTEQMPLTLPRMTPAAGQTYADLELVCGVIAGTEDQAGQAQDSPDTNAAFAAYPFEFLIQQVGHNAPDLLAAGQQQHPVYFALTQLQATNTITVLDELYAPEIGITIEAIYPDGLPDLSWSSFRYRWSDAATGGERIALVPPNGQFYSGNTSAYIIEEQLPAGWTARNAVALQAGQPAPAAFAGPGSSPTQLAPPGGTLVLLARTAIYKKEWIRRWILIHRDFYNQNNPTRTDFYLRYYMRHTEVPWSLLAHLVSRNAGYQMSDIQRFRLYRQLLIAGGTLNGVPIINFLTQELVLLVLIFTGDSDFDAFFAFLEAPNFLIFRDVVPQLLAYEWAKLLYVLDRQDHSAELFDMLADPEFGVEPLMINEWKTFFAAALHAAWWPGPSAAELVDPAVRRPRLAMLVNEPGVVHLARAQIANEQNHIERRVVNDPAERYIGRFMRPTKHWIAAVNALGRTRLGIPQATSAANAASNRVLVYTVNDFLNLDDRIATGNNLFDGVFRADAIDAQRRDLIDAWATGSPIHHGTRVDYNPAGYGTDVTTIVPVNERWSPPMVDFQGHPPIWPIAPATDPKFAHTHGVPTKLPAWSTEFPQSKIDTWLNPGAPTQGLVPHNLGEFAEIADSIR